VHRQARNKYVPKYLRTTFKEIHGMREALLLATFEWFRPHIVLVDKVPNGIKGELLKSIQWLKADNPKAKLVLGLRDILDDPDHVRKLWERRKFYDVLDEYYDSIWVFGSAKIYDMVAEYEFPESIAKKMNYCGYIMQSPALRDVQTVRRELGLDPAKKFVLVTAGGGGDGYDVMKTYLRACKNLSGDDANPERTFESLLVLGPDMPPHRQERLRNRAKQTPGIVKIIEFSTDMFNYMNAADLVVCMGGYNTMCEILSLEKQAIVVPRVAPVNEQWIRARRMQALGLVDVIHPDELTPEEMATKLMHGLFEAPARPLTGDMLDTEGLPAISRFVEDEIRGRFA
jgi:predicted glycosyltransferase